MTENHQTKQPEEGKSPKGNKETPQYLPFTFVPIKKSNQEVSSIEEAQEDFVAQAGKPAALPDTKKDQE